MSEPAHASALAGPADLRRRSARLLPGRAAPYPSASASAASRPAPAAWSPATALTWHPPAHCSSTSETRCSSVDGHIHTVEL